MSIAKDYYALLGVSSQADGAVIRAAYRALMRRHHPDVSGSDDAAAQAKAINEAYACLRDADKRAAYDWQRVGPPIGPQPGAAYTGPRRPQRPRPVWTGPSAAPEPPMRWFRPTWGNAIGLGIAALVTVITFTITSTIPPVAPSEVKRAVVPMRVGQGARLTAGADCGSKRSNTSHAVHADCRS